MREVEPADTRPRPHGIALGECDAGVFWCVQELEQGGFLGVLRAGRVTRGRAYALVGFFNEVGDRKMFVAETVESKVGVSTVAAAWKKTKNKLAGSSIADKGLS